MDTAVSTRVLIAIEPYLLATALAALLDRVGIAAEVYEQRAGFDSGKHFCVALVDDTAPRELRRTTTVALPPGSELGEAVISSGDGSVAVVFNRPAEILRIVKNALAASSCCGSGETLALVC